MTQTKRCNTCKQDKLTTGFHKNRKARDGLQANSVVCNTRQAQLAEWRKAGIEMTHEEYDRMHQLQSGKCAICEEAAGEGKRRLHVDHHHGSGQVRRLLCEGCNTGLGKFKDSAGLLRKAAEYLDAHAQMTQKG